MCHGVSLGGLVHVLLGNKLHTYGVLSPAQLDHFPAFLFSKSLCMWNSCFFVSEVRMAVS